MKKRGDTDQSHATQDRKAVNNFQAKINERGKDDHKVKDIPAVAEEIRAQGAHLEYTLGRENRSENLCEPTDRENKTRNETKRETAQTKRKKQNNRAIDFQRA